MSPHDDHPVGLDDALSTRDVARALRCSRRTATRVVARLRHYRIGKSLWLPRSELDRYLAGQFVDPAAEAAS